jgi:para-aminobenzoate synthetase/4-amino-4-deoxychorismate lyase
MKVLIQFENKPKYFDKPKSIISCNNPARLSECFREIKKETGRGYYAAGFLSYEAGYFFEESLRETKSYDFPLICVGIYETPLNSVSEINKYKLRDSIKDLRLNISKETYSQNINKIRDYITIGDVYQITYCIKLLFKYSASPFVLYQALLREQPVPYPAYIESGDFRILSLSPEMFVKKTGTNIITKPMKGTWARGSSIFSDFLGGFRLKFDPKNRAENVMIADLLRNDLGRIGSGIRAPKLFEVDKYATLFQMTSTVTAKAKKDLSFYDLFASIFPSGSVTGAPKIRAMQIIRDLENEERRIYTGAIGYITPGGDLFFNVPIRTILMRGEEGEMGIGGGIVWDSTPLGEWREGLLKAKFLTDLSIDKFSPV